MKGAIYFRESDQRWVGTAELGKDINGKRKRKTVYGKTEKEVQKKLNNLKYEIQNGLYVDKNKDTFIGFLNDYIKLNKSHWEETTLALYELYVKNHIEPYFDKKKLESIKPIDLDKFYLEKMETLSGNTVIKLHKFIKAAFNYGIKKGIVAINVANSATPPKFVKFRPTVYNEAEFLELWNYVRDEYDRVPIALGAGVGLRRGEIFGLTWNNINFEKNTITIDKSRVRFDKDLEKKPKTEESARTVYAPEYVMEVLREYKKEQNITNERDYVLNVKPGYYSKRFKWLLDSFNLPSIRLHDLRHFNATMMLKSGVSDKVAAGRLGHAQVSTLRDIYQHVQIDMDKDASQKLNDMFSEKKL